MRSILQGLFKEKALRQERLGNVIDVLVGHAAGAKMVPPGADANCEQLAATAAEIISAITA